MVIMEYCQWLSCHWMVNYWDRWLSVRIQRSDCGNRRLMHNRLVDLVLYREFNSAASLKLKYLRQLHLVNDFACYCGIMDVDVWIHFWFQKHPSLFWRLCCIFIWFHTCVCQSRISSLFVGPFTRSCLFQLRASFHKKINHHFAAN